MARPLRIELAGGLYHVTSRGDRREDIYLDDGDQRPRGQVSHYTQNQSQCEVVRSRPTHPLLAHPHVFPSK